ncbi:MAG: hypothetical protein SPE21_05775 [Candidatus Cryptobacteroides sp.]|nr:hypothetical protein [Candidatus Cryptobacteroides sp.]
MKKFVYSFGMFVAATMTFASCAKEISPETTEEVTHVMTINVGKAVDSKTAVVEGETEATYKWSESDKKYFHVYESTTDGQGNETKTEGLVTEVFYSDDMSTASLSVSFTSSAEGPYTYTVIYANTLNTNGNPVIPERQSPLVGNFDPAADVLISKPIVSQTRIDALDMIMGRVATINKMTLKGLDAGEKISKVEFALDKGLSASYILGTGNYSTSSKKLTMSYEAAVAGSDGTFPVYFVSAPVEKAAIESVVVTTDKKVYTKSSTLSPNPFEGKSITFAVGTMKRFGMDMEGYGEAISTGVTYVKATSLEAFGDSQTVIIVGTDGTSYFTMGTQNDNNRSSVEITSSVNETADKVILDNTSGAHTFILAKSGSSFTFLDTDETSGYLYAAGTSSGNYLRSKTEIGDDCYWNLKFNSANLEVKSVNNTYTPYMQYNSSQLFACYKGTSQKPVMIFVDASTKIQALGTPQNLKTSVTDNVVTVSWNAVDKADSYDVTCAGQKKNVTTTEATFGNVAVGTYEISVVAVSNNQASFKNSAAAVTSVIVGKPTLDKPVIKTVNETANGFYAELESAVQYAESYSWVLYEGSVADGIFVGNGTNTTEKFSITINETDFLITAFKPETTYNLVITAEAAAYTSSESDPASFKTAASSGGESIVTGFNAKWTGFTTADNNGQTSISASSENTSATITSKNGNNNKINCAAAGLYSQKMSENDYWLITIPNVTNTVESTTVTVTFGGIKVNKAANKVVYKFQYSIDGTTYNDFGEEYTETTTSVLKTITFMPGVIKENSTLYIRVFVKSGGSTSAGSHYIGTTLTVSAN